MKYLTRSTFLLKKKDLSILKMKSASCQTLRVFMNFIRASTPRYFLKEQVWTKACYHNISKAPKNHLRHKPGESGKVFSKSAKNCLKSGFFFDNDEKHIPIIRNS